MYKAKLRNRDAFNYCSTLSACTHNGIMYKKGDKYQDDCNMCTCEGGCTKKSCPPKRKLHVYMAHLITAYILTGRLVYNYFPIFSVAYISAFLFNLVIKVKHVL